MRYEDEEAEGGFRERKQQPKREFYMNDGRMNLFSFISDERDFGTKVSGKARFAYLKPNTPEIREEYETDR